MAIRRKDGWYVVQMLLREGEYTGVFTPMQQAEGLSESSLMRVRFGLPALKEGLTSGSKKGGKKSNKKSSSSRAGARRKSAAKPPARGGKKGVGEAHGLPFVGHVEGGGRENIEQLDERDIQPPSSGECAGERVGDGDFVLDLDI